ncbi:MAG TPA: ABC transporter substrate-binding protein [Terriglobales bacterium]|nr:ABC transporter substrate-binding protein [Terriglobales bacterium]
MRRVLLVGIVTLIMPLAWAQSTFTCSCGKNPPGKPKNREMRPYAEEPDDLRPYSKFTTPYYEHYTTLVEYNGGARDVADPDPSTITEVRIGFLGPVYDHPDHALGQKMLNGVNMAIEEANAAGGYGGKPFRLMVHNDSATWGASSNEIIKMAYDEKVWAMYGSLSGDSTHIGLRVNLKTEVPMVNSASTDPTIPETIIPWYLETLQDDRVQGYTIARRIYTELGLKRVAILRVNDRYGRFGVLKFKDASRRLGHPVIIEQKFMPGDTDYTHQLKVINDSRVDAIVLWTDEIPAGNILKQMRSLGMKQPVFGSHRTMGADLLRTAGSAADGFEAVYPYDPSSKDSKWLDFQARYEAKYHEKPDHFAALAYDTMQILLHAICEAGLNRGRIRDALTATETYDGVTGHMVFDPNCKDIRSLYWATVSKGQVDYRPATMEKAYARVGEDGVQYAGPKLPDQIATNLKLVVFGPDADELVRSNSLVSMIGELNRRNAQQISLLGIASNVQWGKASSALVQALYDKQAIGIIATDRASSHLAEQLGVKAFVPVIAIADDRSLTSTNIPWIFRLPEGASPDQAIRIFSEAIDRAGANREKIRDVLASGNTIAGVSFESTGELR